VCQGSRDVSKITCLLGDKTFLRPRPTRILPFLLSPFIPCPIAQNLTLKTIRMIAACSPAGSARQRRAEAPRRRAPSPVSGSSFRVWILGHDVSFRVGYQVSFRVGYQVTSFRVWILDHRPQQSAGDDEKYLTSMDCSAPWNDAPPM